MRHIATCTLESGTCDGNFRSDLSGCWRHVSHFTLGDVAERIGQRGNSTSVGSDDNISRFSVSLSSNHLQHGVALRRNIGCNTSQCNTINGGSTATKRRSLDGHDGSDLAIVWRDTLNSTCVLVRKPTSQRNHRARVGGDYNVALCRVVGAASSHLDGRAVRGLDSCFNTEQRDRFSRTAATEHSGAGNGHNSANLPNDRRHCVDHAKLCVGETTFDHCGCTRGGLKCHIDFSGITVLELHNNMRIVLPLDVSREIADLDRFDGVIVGSTFSTQ